MLIAAVLIGASRLLAQTSGSIERALPDLLVLVWYTFLLFSSAISLTGVFWRETTTGLLIERAGLFGIGAACLVYAIALITVGGVAAIAAAGFVLAYSGAALVRAIDIGRILIRIKALAIATQVVLNEGEQQE
jgi:hypothetical protein